MVHMKVKQITPVLHGQMWQAIRAEVINKALPSHGVISQISPNLKRAYVDEGLKVSLSTRSIHPLLWTEQTGGKANFLQNFYTELMERKSSKVKPQGIINWFKGTALQEEQLQEKLEAETCPVCGEKFENPQNCFSITCDCHNGGMNTADGFVVVMGCAWWLQHNCKNISLSISLKYMNITLFLDNVLFQICDCCNPHCITSMNWRRYVTFKPLYKFIIS